MWHYYKFFNDVNSGEVSELEMVNLIESLEKDHKKLELLKKDVEDYRVKIIAKEISKEFLGSKRKVSIIHEKFKRFQNLIDEYSEKQIEYPNPHPSIFEDGAFEIFKKWMKLSNDSLDRRISFVIQQFKQENKLRNTNFKKISDWAYEYDFLDKDTYDKLYVKGCFFSPSKILTKSRIELYNTINSVVR